MSLQQPLAPEAPEMTEAHVLGMAEMGFRGLSEPWLMRRAGDLHWRMIGRAMGQREATFTCARGEPLYAAFCATSLRLRAPKAPGLGGNISLTARLHRVGRSRLASVLGVVCDGQAVGRMVMVSTFVGRGEEGSNRSILRRAPRVMIAPPEAPPWVQGIAQRAVAAEIPGGGQAIRQMPSPATDFNAAGLLYFPSFAALADRADAARGAPFGRWLVARDVAYLGNLDPGEAVDVTFRPARDGHLCRIAGPGGRALALIRSRFT